MSADSGSRAGRLDTVVAWAGRLGTVTAAAAATLDGSSEGSARARLQGAERAGLLMRSRPLAGRPSLYLPTRAGLRACGLTGVQPPRMTAGLAGHALACCHAAAGLASRYPGCQLEGEPMMRLAERAGRGVLAPLGQDASGRPLLHRPDLLLRWPARAPRETLAVEVELTVKSPRRLHGICLAWARCRAVDGVLYVAAPDVVPALERAIDSAAALERIAVLELTSIAESAPPPP